MSLGDFVEIFEGQMRALGYSEPRELRLTTQEKSELAMERAGTRDKKSTAYKSARRTIERRTTEAGQRRGQSFRRFADEVRRRGLRVHAELELDVSPSSEEDMRPREIDLELGGDQIPRTIAALAAGDVGQAGLELKRELLYAYETEGADPGGQAFMPRAQIGDIDALDIGWLAPD